MKWLKSRSKYIAEAKIKDVILPKQAEQVNKLWGPEYLDFDEVEPTTNIKQGLWKLTKEDKIKCFSVFLGTDLDLIYRSFEKTSEHFNEILNKSVVAQSFDNPELFKLMSNMDFKNMSIDQMYNCFNNCFLSLSTAETKATSVIARDEKGRPINDENGKPLKVDKKEGEPIFSKNLVSLTGFIESYNRCYADTQVSAVVVNVITNHVSKVRSMLDQIATAYSFEMDIFSKDLYLQIKHNASDILNISISKFFSSCQDLYSGSHVNRMIGNVFDINSIPAFLKFDSPIYFKGTIISNFLPLARVMIRNIDKEGDKFDLFFDRTYPDRMNEIMVTMVTKYSENKNTYKGKEYPLYADYGDKVPASDPYMDRLTLKRKNYIGVNTKKINLSKDIDWSDVKISPNINVEEIIIETDKIPNDFNKIGIKTNVLKFKTLKLDNNLTDLNIKANKLVFDRCEITQNIIKEITNMGVREISFDVCNMEKLDLSELDLDYINVSFCTSDKKSFDEIFGDIKLKKLKASGDLTQDTKLIDRLRDQGTELDVLGPRILFRKPAAK